ncbi:hypothetical protein MKK75_18590, partial [Methylobacterium sp. J-030]|uniref:hypothetical protein n=1 Tax=Methylobacterium sp. J-030 TaxID=2836627 RepID=UPI001FB945C9
NLAACVLLRECFRSGSFDVRTPQDRVLNLRLPASMRRDLDAAAHAGGVRLSVATRTALAVGLAAIRTNDQPDPPPPAGPAAALRAAA